MTISGKVAIVTGSSKGIGLETCKILLSNGVKVAGWSRSQSPINDENFLQVYADVADYSDVEKAHALTVEHFGTVDFLINNAGLGYIGEFEHLPMNEWQKMFDVNVNGIFYCSRLVVPGMKKKDAGHIVNVGSIAGLNGVKGMVGYAATKHAVTGMSHSMFMELRDFGIKVTCIYPGSVKTQFFNDIDGIDAHDNMMKPEDIAETILHVLSTSANYHPVDIEVRPLKPKG